MRAVASGDQSPFPEASVARLPKNAKKKSAVLVARSMEYLVVRVTFHGAPVAGVKVQFGCIADIDDKSPDKLEPVLTTNDDGLVCFPRLVVAGIYACEIERQPSTIVSTVAQLQRPYPVVLPIGRPLVDIGDVDEFAAKRPARPAAAAPDSDAEDGPAGPARARKRTGPVSFKIVHAAAPDEPLAHVHVHVTFPDGTVREFESDDGGVITLETAAPGEYQVTPFDPNELLALNDS